MLEDDFSDVFRKAKRGTGVEDAAIAAQTGLPVASLAAWTKGEGVPSEDVARTIAPLLSLDPGKFADLAAQRWHPHVAMPPDVRHHPQDPHPSNGYLFHLEDGRTAALIDPAGISPMLATRSNAILPPK